jgi:hypothetical protein
VRLTGRGPSGGAGLRLARLVVATIEDQLMLAVKVLPFWKETLPPLHTFGTLMDPW